MSLGAAHVKPLDRSSNEKDGMDQQRKYREAVNLLADGVKACWKQSLALLAEANSVRARGSHSLALSLAVLAMEEVGKLMLTACCSRSMVTKEVSLSTKGFETTKQS